MKKLVISSLILSVLLAAFAFADTPANPSSKRSASTQGLFGTDVDDYYSVTGWSNVEPENLFGFMGYNSGVGGINWGLAHQFDSFYSAFYFGGTVDGFSTGNSKYAVTDGDTTKTNTSTSNKDGDFTTGVLFGFDDIGIKLSVMFESYNISTSKTDTDPVTITKVLDYELFPALSFGMINQELGNWDAEYSAFAGLRSVVDKQIDIQGTEDSTDNSVYLLTIGGGLSLNQEKDKLVHNLSAGIDSYFGIYPKKIQSTPVGDDSIATNAYGQSGFKLDLTPSYTLTYNASEKLTLKFRAIEKISFEASKDTDYTESDGTKAYNPSRGSSTEISFDPYLSAALSYKLITKKHQVPVYLNTGIFIDAPDCGLLFGKVVGRNTDDGTVLSTDSSSTFTVQSEDGYCSWSSGFTVEPSKNITFDASYRILANIFGNDFRTDFTEGDGVGIWDTLNKLIVHNIDIGVSVKF